jgi:hypothetical protein
MYHWDQKEMDIQNLFPQNYEESRNRFREMLPHLQKKWPNAKLHHHPLKNSPEISIDWITAKGVQSNEKMLLFTTGEHGIEGYVGSAILELFYQKFIALLNQNTTGITLVHMIDPWGMKHWRRTNPNNIDLNRNFVWDEEQIDPGFNPDYHNIINLVNPSQEIKHLKWERLIFLFKYLYYMAKFWKKNFWSTKALGQYNYPEGIHYGGSQYQEEVQQIKSIFRQAFEGYNQLLHLDMHTGYGPRYQMTIVNSVLESKNSDDFVKEIDYPLVAAMNPEEFYEVRGDMIDFVYMLRDKEFPDTDLYATAFEFGTFGISHWGKLRSLRAMVQENQWYWHGAGSREIEESVRQEFLESFSPSEQKWRQKAVADADQALRGIMKMEKFI